MRKFKTKHIRQGWSLNQFNETENSFWLTVPPDTNCKAIVPNLKNLPGGSSEFIMIDVYDGIEIYFRCNLSFKDCFNAVIDALGLEYCPVIPKISKKVGMRGEPILQCTLDGKVIKEWVSASLAARETGINVGNICLCCRGKHKTTGGYTWKYKNK